MAVPIYPVANNNQLTSFTNDHGGTTAYVYDALGRLVTETQGGTTRSYSWTGASLLAGVDSSAAAETDTSYFYTAGDSKRLWRFEDANLKNTYSTGNGFGVSRESSWTRSNPATVVATKTYVRGWPRSASRM